MELGLQKQTSVIDFFLHENVGKMVKIRLISRYPVNTVKTVFSE